MQYIKHLEHPRLVTRKVSLADLYSRFFLWDNFSEYLKNRFEVISSGTDEDRAKRDLNLCNESVNGHFWSNMCLNCIFKWT